MVVVADAVLRGSLPAAVLESRPEIVGYARALVSSQDPEGYAQACEALAGSQDPEWGAIRAKVSIVSGKEDKVSTPELGQAIAGLLKGSGKVDVTTWDGAGHWLMLENPTGAVEVVREAMGR